MPTEMNEECAGRKHVTVEQLSTAGSTREFYVSSTLKFSHSNLTQRHEDAKSLRQTRQNAERINLRRMQSLLDTQDILVDPIHLSHVTNAPHADSLVMLPKRRNTDRERVELLQAISL